MVEYLLRYSKPLGPFSFVSNFSKENLSITCDLGEYYGPSAIHFHLIIESKDLVGMVFSTDSVYCFNKVHCSMLLHMVNMMAHNLDFLWQLSYLG